MSMKKIIALLVLVPAAIIAIAIPFTSGIGSEQYTIGKHYKELPNALPTAAGEGEIEVREFFWYGCGHCYEAEKVLGDWKKSLPSNVKFIQTPAIFSERWELLARAYYIAEALNILDKTHTALFDQIHKDKKQVRSIDELAAFFAKFDVSREKFDEMNKSFALKTELKRAAKLIRDYRLTSVPNFVVAGKYITGASYAGSHEEALRVIDHLIKQESK